MPVDDPKDLERVDQQIHIEELKRQIDAVTGGEMAHWQGEDLPPEIAEQFYENVLAYESAEETTMFRKLTEAGVLLPPAEKLSDQDLTAKLWQIIRKMAEFGHYVCSTDHLSDRDLYIRMTTDTFHQPFADMPASAGSWHVDFASSGSDEDTEDYLRYYADEETRQQFASEFDLTLPPHEDPPYDRDRHLPISPMEEERLRMLEEMEQEEDGGDGEGE